MMKLALVLLCSLALFGSANASISMNLPPPDQLDRTKLDEILKRVDHVIVSYALEALKVERGRISYPIPATHTAVDTDDKAWLSEFATFLRSVDGEAEHLTAAIALHLSMANLYHGEKVLLNLFWVDDERLVLYTTDWTVQLRMGHEVLVSYQALCAKKKPAVEIEPRQKSQQLKVPLPAIDPKSLNIKLPNEPSSQASPSTSAQPSTKPVIGRAPVSEAQHSSPIGFHVDPDFLGGESVLRVARKAFPECGYISLSNFMIGSDTHYEYALCFAGREIKVGFESVYYRYLIFAKRKEANDWESARVFDWPGSFTEPFCGPIRLLETKAEELGIRPKPPQSKRP